MAVTANDDHHDDEVDNENVENFNESQPLNLVLSESAATPPAAIIHHDKLLLLRTSSPSVTDDAANPAKRMRTLTPPAVAPATAAPATATVSAVLPPDFLQIALQKVLRMQADLALIDAEAEAAAAAAAANDTRQHALHRNGGDAREETYSDSGNEEEDNDFLESEAEALGFAMCAREALTFLAANGEQSDGELMRRLRARLVGNCEGLPI